MPLEARKERRLKENWNSRWLVGFEQRFSCDSSTNIFNAIIIARHRSRTANCIQVHNCVTERWNVSMLYVVVIKLFMYCSVMDPASSAEWAWPPREKWIFSLIIVHHRTCLEPGAELFSYVFPIRTWLASQLSSASRVCMRLWHAQQTRASSLLCSKPSCGRARQYDTFAIQKMLLRCRNKNR